MAFTPIANTAKIELLYTLDGGQTAVNVLHCFCAPGESNANLLIIANTVRNAINVSNIKTRWTTTTTLQDVIATDITSATGRQQHTNAGPIVGTDAGAPLPNQIALVATLLTAVRSRRTRGRIYWPGFGEAASAGNSPVVGCTADVLGATTSIRTSLAAALFPLTVASRLNGVSAIVDSERVGNVWDSQRRRRIPVN